MNMKLRGYGTVTISKKGENWIANGHPWIFGSDVVRQDEGIENGSLVDVISEKGKYLGTGFISLESKIRVRLLTRDYQVSIDDAFFKRRIEYAWNYRKTVMKDQLSCTRILFSEADQLPGIIVDRFNDVLVSEVLTFGMDAHKDVIYDSLLKVLKEDGVSVRGIYERNDVSSRRLEGLSEYKGWYGETDHGETETVINENGVFMRVDFENGQKTGYFLDQKRNRKKVAEISEGRRVLDCFTHTGSFAINCALNGAKSVTAVDISETAIENARRNAELNGADIRFITGDVFKVLEEVNRKEYDLIILDPPAFTKSRDRTRNAYNGYLEINSRAMKLLPRGGYLCTCSCSHFMPHELFEKMLSEAMQKTGIYLKMVSVSRQAEDHPIMLNIPETDYLKFYILQTV
ncbi:MAG: class I SAM-dependent rRNA methyltransferase [Clostridia bacterium]|nr:class I SAM-dependent rRNA methyltransferase [Clostridia bacterium]